ncbi:MAG: ATP-binding protein [Desulfurivibrionaceae bacterium]|nr:ATP-binding protein [Desulfobulbales bacterium]MDT8335134.1 ATP-binding protein [Desulfurivibrionaceae bacterium]
MATVLPDDKKWEEAFVLYGFDAAVGRLFRGIIHNLNGVGQAFMMQTELLNMMFKQTDAALAEIERAENPEERRGKIAALRKMLAGRAELAKHLTDEVGVFQKIMQRTSLVTREVGEQILADVYELGSVIELELEFLNSDGFFKHKIGKTLGLADNLPELTGRRIELHQIIGALLENASQILAENSGEVAAPEISITAAVDQEEVVIEVCDNGPGIGAGEREKIFAPFYTTRAGHLGMGLYLARTLAENAGGKLTCESLPGRSCFILRMPVKGDKG